MTGILELLFERRFHPSSEPPDWFMRIAGGRTSAGVDVTPESSLRSTAVFAATRVLSQGVATLPLILYRRLSNRAKERATDHNLYNKLRWLPNPEMTSVDFKSTLQGHAVLWGNAYAEIEYNNAGDVTGLWPLRPDKTRPVRRNGQLVYEITMPSGDKIGLPAIRVMHIRGMGYDGNVGYSPIALARQAIGLTLATEEFGARFFGSGAKPSAILKHPGNLSDGAESRLRASWEMMHSGLENSHRIAILEEGMDLMTIGIPPEDAQFLETRKFQISEIARLLGVQPHKIADLERSTNNNIEHQGREFITDSLGPWLVRWEQAIYRDLLTESERQVLFAEHLLDALLRGDTLARFQTYAIGRQNGIYNANDVLRMENQNPREDEAANDYWRPANMLVDGLIMPNESQRSERRSLPDYETRAQQIATSRRRLANSMQGIIEDTVSRVIRREVNDVRRATRKFLRNRTAQEFGLWLQEFYEEHKEFWQRQMMPILRSYAEQIGVSVADELGGDPRGANDIPKFLDAYLEKMAARQVGKSFGTLQRLLEESARDGNEPEEVIEKELEQWESYRPAQIAFKETHYANNALAKAFYVLVGVAEIRWVTSGKNCPYCDNLDGAVVGIEKFFLQQGADFQPDGADGPITPRSNIGHPPAHDGCDCSIIASI